MSSVGVWVRSPVDFDDESDTSSLQSLPLSRVSSKDERKSIRRAAALRKNPQIAGVDDLNKMKVFPQLQIYFSYNKRLTSVFHAVSWTVLRFRILERQGFIG